MFTGFTQETSDFFWELQFNNERTWFNAHRQQFESAVHVPFDALANDTLALWRQAHPERTWSMHVARIYRDARRLFGRGPYKEHLWFSLQERREMCETPMLWFEIGAGDFARGVGFWEASTVQMQNYRARIDANTAAFEGVIAPLIADARFVPVGELYKRPRRAVSAALHPWYNCKRPVVEYQQPFGGEVLSPKLPQILVRDFELLFPYYDFLHGCC